MFILFGILSFFVGTIVCDRKLEQDLQELKTFTVNQLKEIHLRLAEKDERIKMLETIEVDSGNNYNVNDGIFDVPFTGTYVFTVAIAGAGNRFAMAEIIVNGHIKGTVVADGTDVDDDITTSASVIVVHANIGDHMFVRLGWSSSASCDIYNNLAFTRNSFSGWLLF